MLTEFSSAFKDFRYERTTYVSTFPKGINHISYDYSFSSVYMHSLNDVKNLNPSKTYFDLTLLIQSQTSVHIK